MLGKFDGVADQIDQNLAQPPRVAAQQTGNRRFDQAVEFEIFLLRPDGQHLDRIFHRNAQIEIQGLQLQLAGFNLGEIQNLVDDRQQRLATGAHDLGVLALFGGQFRVQQQSRHANYPVHRRANLVAHIGQELALGAVGRFRRFSGPVQGGFAVFLFGNIGGESVPENAAIRLALGNRIAVTPFHGLVGKEYPVFTLPRAQGLRGFRQGLRHPLVIVGVNEDKHRAGILSNRIGRQTENPAYSLADVGKADAPVRKLPKLIQHTGDLGSDLTEPLLPLPQRRQGRTVAAARQKQRQQQGGQQQGDQDRRQTDPGDQLQPVPGGDIHFHHGDWLPRWVHQRRQPAHPGSPLVSLRTLDGEAAPVKHLEQRRGDIVIDLSGRRLIGRTGRFGIH